MLDKKIPIGSSNFAEIIRDNYYFVDKSLAIKTIMEDAKAILITRPRRWGKSLFMSMLEHFLSASVIGIETKGLFDYLKIATVDNGNFLKQHQGQYPVISITFKDVVAENFDSALANIYEQLSRAFKAHRYLLESDKIYPDEKKVLAHIVEGEFLADIKLTLKEMPHRELSKNFTMLALYTQSLKMLTELLYRYHGKKAYLLIDEYDTPLNAAYTFNYLEELSTFMRQLLGAALKDNPFLEKGIMTGILRVSKNNMLSELNNLKIYTVLDAKYKESFGFTREEVSALLALKGKQLSLSEIEQWYNGYNIDGLLLYNPWSIMSAIEEGKLKPYWVFTSVDRMLKDVLMSSSDSIKDKFEKLIKGEGIKESIHIHLMYEELMGDNAFIWTLLLFCGYLKAENVSSERTHYNCELKIPNYEVDSLYLDIFTDWLKKNIGIDRHDSFLQNLAHGNVEQFTKNLTDYLLTSTSHFDFTTESNYHTFVLGLLSGIRSTHNIESNKEYALGRPDCLLIPLDATNHLGICLEFKYIKQPEKSTKNIGIKKLQILLKKEAENAMAQMDIKGYEYAFAHNRHIKKILKVAVVFAHRCVMSASEFENKL